MIKELPEDPQQEPIADAFARAAVEIGVARRLGVLFTPGRGTLPVGARMTHHLDQNEAEIDALDDAPEWSAPYPGGRYLPVMPSRGLERLKKYGVIRDDPSPTPR